MLYDADTNLQQELGGEKCSPLIAALGWYNPRVISESIIQMLMNHKADIEYSDHEGNTALLHAVEHHPSLDLIQLLYNNNANIHCRNHFGHTVLHYAVGHFVRDEEHFNHDYKEIIEFS